MNSPVNFEAAHGKYHDVYVQPLDKNKAKVLQELCSAEGVHDWTVKESKDDLLEAMSIDHPEHYSLTVVSGDGQELPMIDEDKTKDYLSHLAVDSYLLIKKIS